MRAPRIPSLVAGNGRSGKGGLQLRPGPRPGGDGWAFALSVISIVLIDSHDLGVSRVYRAGPRGVRSGVNQHRREEAWKTGTAVFAAGDF